MGTRSMCAPAWVILLVITPTRSKLYYVLKLAKQYTAGLDVDKHQQDFLDFEGTVIAKYGNKETVHG
jgi:hypothetical protein